MCVKHKTMRICLFYEVAEFVWEVKMISVYLDSQDYSVLSDEARLSSEQRALKEIILNYSKGGLVRFCFSGVLVCEVAPVNKRSTTYAVGRASLLSELCGGNALIDLSKLLRCEVQSLMAGGKGSFDVHNGAGEWFPDLDFSADGHPDIYSEIFNMVAADKTLDREHRRAVKRRFFKNGKPTEFAKKSVSDVDFDALIEHLCVQYPMKSEYAEVLVGYWLGTHSADQYNNAMKGSLKDPQWMMKWFSSSPELAEPIARIVRGPSEQMNLMARDLIVASRAFVENMNEAGEKRVVAKGGRMDVLWRKSREEHFLGVLREFCLRENPSWTGDFSYENAQSFCPGFSASYNSLYSSYWDNVRDVRKALPLDSQFADAMHSTYAPYVDIFRADAYMAPHVRRVLNNSGTIVVGRLQDLPEAIESRLNKTQDRGV